MAKKEVKNKEASKKWEHYIISGRKVERKKTCPRCGGGIFLAEHKDRVYCGKCNYTEFKGKEPKTEEKKEETKKEGNRDGKSK